MSVPDRGPVVLAVTAAMISGATIFVSLRMISRVAIVRKVSLDDYFIILAWVIAFGISFIICYGTTFGLGKHERDVASYHRRPLAKAEYVFTVLYNPALMATKTSIGVFYLSLAKTQKIFKWLTISTLVIVNVVGLALTFVNIFQCKPMSALFDGRKPKTAQCTDIVTLYLSSAPVNILTDLALLLLPMPLLKEMHLPRKQKIILYITFGFGVFVTAVDVVRISYLQQAAVARIKKVSPGLPSNGTSNEITASDFSWNAALSFMWSAIEVNVGIMCACVPGLKPLFTRFLPNLVRSSNDMDSKIRSSNSGVYDHQSAPIESVPTSPTYAKEMISSDGKAGGDMSFLDFLTTAEDNEMPENLQRIKTTKTKKTTDTEHKHDTSHFFEFVDMDDTKPIVDMTNRESILPIAEVTVLFFLWGFAYGLLNTLNAQFQTTAGMSSGETQAIHAIYYVGYFVGPLTFGRLVLKIWGFKACYMVGLVIYGTGTLIFWPSAVLTSFPAFLVSNFIVGMGLSTLEIAANPFIALCGPLEYAEVRLNLSQAVQACGSVVSPLLAKKVLFNSVTGQSLIDVQWTYLAITLFTFLLAFVYYCLSLPEASDEDFARSGHRVYSPSVLSQLQKTKTIYVTLGLAVFAQFCYVGAQEAMSTSLESYILFVTGTEVSKNSTGWDYVNTEAIAHTLFAGSRFLAAFSGMLFQRYGLLPRHLLAFCFFGVVLFSALATSTASSAFNVGPTTSAVFALMVYFFEGPMFSLIFAIPLRALGRHTKDGAALLTAAISGGVVFSPIAVATSNARGVQLSLVVLVAAFTAGASLPVYLMVHKLAKTQIDPVHLDPSAAADDGTNDYEASLDNYRPSKSIDILRKKGMGVFSRRKKGGSDNSSDDSDRREGKQRARDAEHVETLEIKADPTADGSDFLTTAI